MTRVKGYFEEVHLTECKISSFEFVNSDLIVHIAKGLDIYKPHPLATVLKISDPCEIIFTNIISSHLTLNIYAGDPRKDGFKEERKIVHKINLNSTIESKTEDFFIEGVLLDPLSWASWDIVAENVYIDDLK